MSEKHKFSDMGEYHDDELRIESYAETADKIVPDVAGRDLDPIDETLVNTVVNQIQRELGTQVGRNPNISTKEIKLQAMHRFMDLIEKQLLTPKEADRCYQRFVQMVHHFYGTP
jgi:hypothetical protein